MYYVEPACRFDSERLLTELVIAHLLSPYGPKYRFHDRNSIELLLFHLKVGVPVEIFSRHCFLVDLLDPTYVDFNFFENGLNLALSWLSCLNGLERKIER